MAEDRSVQTRILLFAARFALGLLQQIISQLPDDPNAPPADGYGRLGDGKILQFLVANRNEILALVLKLTPLFAEPAPPNAAS